MTNISGIPLEHIPNASTGIESIKKLLYTDIDSQTALFLSGGKTPRDLYISLAMDKKLKPGIVALVDERYGEPMHVFSNEKMIQDTGLVDYFSQNSIQYNFILKENCDLQKTAEDYEQTISSLLQQFSKRIAVLGIGIDGHIAGIPAGIDSSQLIINSDRLVDYYDNSDGLYKQRITTTCKTLEQMDKLLVIVFGEDKRKALSLLFAEGTEDEVPARFLKRPEVAKKTLLITDQIV